MLPHKPATLVKKPGQATHNDVLQTKSCSNVNKQQQKPSYSDEQLKKPVIVYKKKYKNRLFVRTSKVKKLIILCVRASSTHLPSVIISGQ